MRTAVADTGRPRYLVEIQLIDLLPHLFETVLIPEPVSGDLLHASAPWMVRRWAGAPPVWLKVVPPPATTDPALLSLPKGERAALALGLSLPADLILIDDRKGASVARQKGMATAGTLGILVRAARRDLVVLPEAFGRLRQTNFYCAPDLLHSLLTEEAQRRAP